MRSLTTALSFLPAGLFPFAALAIGLRNPTIFQAPSLVSHAPVPALLFVLALAALLVLSRRSERIRENRPGLLLFFLFAAGYFLLASLFNKPDLNTNNIYFAADSWSWLQRMALAEGVTVKTRAVHPLAPILFRPLISVLALLAGGDRYQTNLALLALAGGGCVFLMWKIVRQRSQETDHAVLCASLLGLSASHLIFASVVESYIFSALGLLLFLWLLLRERPLYLLVPAGILTLGITATNIAQEALMTLFVQRNFKRLVVIFSCIVLLSLALNVLAHALYPVSYFFLPESVAEEKAYFRELSLKRVGLMAENLFVYNIVAPQPYLSFRQEMPRFNFLNGTLGDYAWFGWPALIGWSALLAASLFQFVNKIRSDPAGKYLAFSLLACLLFNLLLHIGYGTEPFLYSADWTYAVVLFAALALYGLAERLWFKAAFLILVLAIFVNNLGFLYIIARKVSEFLV